MSGKKITQIKIHSKSSIKDVFWFWLGNAVAGMHLPSFKPSKMPRKFGAPSKATGAALFRQREPKKSHWSPSANRRPSGSCRTSASMDGGAGGGGRSSAYTAVAGYPEFPWQRNDTEQIFEAKVWPRLPCFIKDTCQPGSERKLAVATWRGNLRTK